MLGRDVNAGSLPPDGTSRTGSGVTAGELLGGWEVEGGGGWEGVGAWSTGWSANQGSILD